MSGLCPGCGAAVATDTLFCPRCGTPVGSRPPVPSVPPLPLIGTIGRPEPRASRPPAPPSGGPASGSGHSRRALALGIDLLPFLLLGVVALVGWLQPISSWGRPSGREWLTVGGAGIVLLLVQASLVAAGSSIGRACTGRSRRARPAPAASSSSDAAPPSWSSPPIPSGSLPMPAWSVPPTPSWSSPPTPAGPAARWSLVLDNGRTLDLRGPTVVGRDPAALPGEAVRLLAIPDETRTVSKTHVKLDPGTDSVLVTDRHSTNGVVVIAAGVATRCRAGEPMVATAGSVVRFGDREMQVRRP